MSAAAELKSGLIAAINAVESATISRAEDGMAWARQQAEDLRNIVASVDSADDLDAVTTRAVEQQQAALLAHAATVNLTNDAASRILQLIATAKSEWPAPTPPSGFDVEVGVFRSPSNKANIDAHSAWQKRANEWAVAFHGKGTDGPEKIGWVLDAHRNGAYRLNIRLGLAGGWGTLEDVAAGRHDQKFAAAARALVAAGRGDSVISLGWEPNIKGFAHSAVGREATYVKAYQRAVSAMRPDAPDLEFSYDLLIGNGGIDWRRAYPGDGYVDWIGLDAYDNSTVSNTNGTNATPKDPEARWNHLLTRAIGINEVLDFADAHGKRKAFFEWGTLLRTDKYATLSGGDNPRYINGIFDVAEARDVVLCYFEDDDGATGALHRLMGSTKFPKSRDAYLKRVLEKV